MSDFLAFNIFLFYAARLYVFFSHCSARSMPNMKHIYTLAQKMYCTSVYTYRACIVMYMYHLYRNCWCSFFFFSLICVIFSVSRGKHYHPQMW